MNKTLAAMVLGMVVVGGCAGESGQSEESTGDEGEALVSETVVSVDAEGKEQVTSRLITQAEADRVLAARVARQQAAAAGVGEAQEALTTDTGCAGASLWLQDGTNQSGNRICFARSVPVNDGASLSSYCRLRHASGSGIYSYWICDATWSGAVRSFWGGVDNGTFSKPGAQPYYFNAYERADVPGAPVTGATRVELASTCKRRLCPQNACADGEWCNNGVCSINAQTAWCSNGVSYTSGGDMATCEYYACGSDGHCKRSCTTSFDCAQGASCDLTTGLCSAAYCGNAGCGITWMGGETNAGSTTPSQPSDSTGSCSYVSCSSDAGCVANEMCHNGACVPFTQHCTADLTGMVWWDHNTYDCGNYVCSPNRGYCFSDCRTTLDCAAGKICDGQHCI
jgi:hypothetical protein